MHQVVKIFNRKLRFASALTSGLSHHRRVTRTQLFRDSLLAHFTFTSGSVAVGRTESCDYSPWKSNCKGKDCIQFGFAISFLASFPYTEFHQSVLDKIKDQKGHLSNYVKHKTYLKFNKLQLFRKIYFNEFGYSVVTLM